MAKATNKIITPVGTLSFPNLVTPNEKGKFAASIVFAPGTDVSVIEGLIQNAVETLVPADVNPKSLRLPMQRDGAEKSHLGGPYVDGAKFFEAKTNFQPGVVGPDRQPILNVADELYPGALVRFQIHAFYYSTDGNRGIGIGLDNVQKAGEGARLDGAVAAEDVFGAIDTDDLL